MGDGSGRCPVARGNVVRVALADAIIALGPHDAGAATIVSGTTIQLPPGPVVVAGAVQLESVGGADIVLPTQVFQAMHGMSTRLPLGSIINVAAPAPPAATRILAAPGVITNRVIHVPAGNALVLGGAVRLPGGLLLGGETSLPAGPAGDINLAFAAILPPGAAIIPPAGVIININGLATSGTVRGVPSSGLALPAGTTIPGDSVLPAGLLLPRETKLPAGFRLPGLSVIPATFPVWPGSEIVGGWHLPGRPAAATDKEDEEEEEEEEKVVKEEMEKGEQGEEEREEEEREEEEKVEVKEEED